MSLQAKWAKKSVGIRSAIIIGLFMVIAAIIGICPYLIELIFNDKSPDLTRWNSETPIKFLPIDNLERKISEFKFNEEGEILNLTFISNSWNFKVKFRIPSKILVAELKDSIIWHFQLKKHMKIAGTLHEYQFKLLDNYKELNESIYDKSHTTLKALTLKETGLKDGSILRLQIKYIGELMTWDPMIRDKGFI